MSRRRPSWLVLAPGAALLLSSCLNFMEPPPCIDARKRAEELCRTDDDRVDFARLQENGVLDRADTCGQAWLDNPDDMAIHALWADCVVAEGTDSCDAVEACGLLELE